MPPENLDHYPRPCKCVLTLKNYVTIFGEALGSLVNLKKLFDQNNNSLIAMKSEILGKTLQNLNTTIINLKTFAIVVQRKYSDQPSILYIVGSLSSLSKIIYLELDIYLNMNVCLDISDKELTDCLNDCIQRLFQLKTLEFEFDCHKKRYCKLVAVKNLKDGDQDYFVVEEIKENMNSFLEKCGKLETLI